MTVGTADEEVSPQRCEQFAARVKRDSPNLELVVYEGAEHNYDDPGKEKQSNPANRRATEDTVRRAERLFEEYLKH